MRTPVFASPVARYRQSALAIVALSCPMQPLLAEPVSKLQPAYVQRSAYTPPTPGVRRAPDAPSNLAPAAQVEARLVLLAKNDQRQDLRLKNLEKDVDYLEKITGAAHSTQSSASYRPPTPPSPAKSYTVRAGDTLWRIAAKHHISINDIRAANRMSNDTVLLGQTLVIPESGGATAGPAPAGPLPNVYVVKAGDTFSQVAQVHRVSQDALARANSSVCPARLLVGTRLVIPGKNAAPAADSPPPPPAPLPAKDPMLSHTVRPGESLGVIAKSYGVPTASVAAANRLKNPDLLVAGQRLVIPSGASGPSTAGFASVAANKPVPDNSASAGNAAPLREIISTVASQPAVYSLTTLTAEPSAPAAVLSKPASMPMGVHRGVLAYRLEPGDTVDTVANMFSTTSHKIREMNNLSAGAVVKEGDELVVPAMGPVSLN